MSGHLPVPQTLICSHLITSLIASLPCQYLRIPWKNSTPTSSSEISVHLVIETMPSFYFPQPQLLIASALAIFKGGRSFASFEELAFSMFNFLQKLHVSRGTSTLFQLADRSSDYHYHYSPAF